MMSNINRHRHSRSKTASPERELSRDDNGSPSSSSSSITLLDVNHSNIHHSPAQEEEEEKCKPHAHVYYWYRASMHTIVPHAILCLKRRNCHYSINNHHYHRTSSNKKRLSFVFWFLVFLGLVLSLWHLARFYPGDQTLRATSESRVRFFFSGCGVSIGRFQLLGCSPLPSSSISSSTTLTERNYKPHDKTKDESISWNHVFSRDLSLQEGVKEMQQLHHCYFHILDTRPALILYDSGRMFEYNLTIQPEGIIPPEEHLDNFKCTYFRAAEYREEKPHKKPKTWKIVGDGMAGKVVILNLATSLQMLEGYHESLLNHYAYTKHHGYAFILSLVSPTKLEGRSGKFSKHLALGVHAATRHYDVSCHIDLDAWFASWDPLSRYANHWPVNKDLFFGDTGQVWLNSGLMCVRSTNWAIRFLEKVVNAVYSVSSNTNNNKRMNIGFRRDQPAVWHVLGMEWAAHNLVPYKGNQCLGWNHCNPKTPPGDCWHLCFWDALQQMDWWEGLESLSQYLPHLYLEPPNKESHVHHGHAHIRNSNNNNNHNKDDDKNDVSNMNPPMHRMCLRSCYSVLSRAGLGMCSWMTSYYRSNHHPLDRCSLSSLSSSSSQVAVAHGSMCDGRGCLEQMEDNGGAWLKHAGHQHWLDILPSCIPLNQEEASQPCHHLRNIRSTSTNTKKMTAPPPRAPRMQQDAPNNIRTRRLIIL